MSEWRSTYLVLAISMVILLPGLASAAGHTWDVNEVFSDASGAIQFIELWEANGTAGETGVGNGSLSSNTQGFAFGAGNVAVPTSNKHYLIGTPAFAALPGAPAPDVVIPAGSIPFFAPAGDTVAHGGIDSWTFTGVPINGTDSLHRLTGISANSPTNYAGITGSVVVVPAAPVPSLGGVSLGLGVAALLTIGCQRIRRAQRLHA